MYRPIAAFIFVALVACPGPGLHAAPKAVTISAEPKPVASAPQAGVSAPVAGAPASAFDAFFDGAEKILKVVAFVVGGAWVYFNYFKGRTYKPRLEVKVVCTRLNETVPNLLKIIAQVKNVGLSKVEIQDRGTGVVIYGLDMAPTVRDWVRLQVHPIVSERNKWIEPGVPIEDQIVVSIEEGTYAAFKAKLVLNSPSVTWTAISIT